MTLNISETQTKIYGIVANAINEAFEDGVKLGHQKERSAFLQKPRSGLTAEQILETLTLQKFYNWYDDDFAAYIQADEGYKSKEEILADIKRLFNLE